MASNNAFTLNGAIGGNPLYSSPANVNASNPFAKALDLSVAPNGKFGSSGSTSGISNTLGANPTAYQTPQAPTHPTAPTNQQVTEHSTTDAQGNTTKVKYAPTSGMLDNPNLAGAASSSPAPTTGAYKGYVNSSVDNAARGAQDIKNASQLTPEQKASYAALANLENAKQDTLNRIYANGNQSLDSQTGGAGQITRNIGLQEQALQQQLGLANQSQQQALQGATSAANLNTNTALSAAGLAAPQSYGLLNQPYNPIEDTYGGGQEQGATDRAGRAGRITAAQSNAQTGGTATVDANHAVYNQAVQQQAETQNAVSNVDQFGKILMDPAQNGGVNPLTLNLGNRLIRDLESQFSNGPQAKFASTLAALQTQIGALIKTSGNDLPSDIASKANSIIDGTASLDTMRQVLDRIGQEGNTLLKNIENKKNQAYSAINQGGSSASLSAPGGFGWDGK